MSTESAIEDTIKEQIANNTILLYMKGNPEQPMCGFSAQVTQALMACGKRFAYVDILSNPEFVRRFPRSQTGRLFPSYTSMVS
jgi:monothiol glutaredoxin